MFMIRRDKNDREVIELLRENSKQSVQELAKRISLPPTTVHNRIKRLEQHRTIKRFTIDLDWNALGKQVTAFVLASVEYIMPTGGRVRQEDIAREIRGLPGVDEVHVLTGGADILAKVRVKDIAELNEFLIQKLRTVPGVDKTQTMIVLSTV